MASYFRQVPDFEYVSRDDDSKGISNFTPVKNLFKRGKLRDDIFGNLSLFEKYSIKGDERPDNVAFKFYEDSTLDWVILLANNILNVQSEWPLPQQVFDEVMLKKYGTYEKLYSDIHHYETKEIKDSSGAIVLPGGLRSPNTWRTNGNFIQISNNKISQIFSNSDGVVTITMNNGISNLTVGDQVNVQNVSESVYNGKFVVTGTTSISGSVISFTYELDTVPTVLNPVMSTSNREEVLFTVYDIIGSGNSFYFEFFDEILEEYSTISSTDLLTPITNYEYESIEEEKKRNILILKGDYLRIVQDDIATIMPYKIGAAQYRNSTLKRGDNIRLYQSSTLSECLTITKSIIFIRVNGLGWSDVRSIKVCCSAGGLLDSKLGVKDPRPSLSSS